MTDNIPPLEEQNDIMFALLATVASIALLFSIVFILPKLWLWYMVPLGAPIISAAHALILYMFMRVTFIEFQQRTYYQGAVDNFARMIMFWFLFGFAWVLKGHI